MSAVQRAYCRAFQAIFAVGARLLPWRKAQVVSGEHATERIPSLLHGLGVQRPMVVTGPRLLATGVIAGLLNALDRDGIPYALFSEVEANPSVDTANKIAECYRASGCDSIVAIGGGSPMDAAKAAGARVARPRQSVQQLSGLLRVWKKIPPLIAVPTTAGTGSETTIAALVTDTETHHKCAMMDLRLIPRYAVLDPELTLGLPPHSTAATGMDALTHAIEAYLCWTYNTKESLRFAREAVALIFENLPRAYANGKNREARANMLLASYKAGFAFTRAGVGNVHAIAHTLGGLYNTPHGLANAVLLPVVLEDYGESVYPKLAELARCARVAVGGGDAADAKAFINAIRSLNTAMDIPAGFDFILDKDIPQMVTWALQEANPLYPVPVLYDRARCSRVIEKIRV